MLDALLAASFPAATVATPLRCQARDVVVLTPELLAAAVSAVVPDERILVVVSDQTRKTGADLILPLLLDGWRHRGVREADLELIVACGSHRAPEPPELERLVGGRDVLDAFGAGVTAHDAFMSPCRCVGHTRRGTPVEVSVRALEAAALVTVGGVTPHYFAGFTGGRKSVVPGLASARTIAANHSLTIDFSTQSFRHGVEIGALAGNAVAEDLEEAAALVPVRASVQTVLDGEARLVGCCCGPLQAAHRRACDLARDCFFCRLPALADVVVASAGPARNWLQSHKALVNASRAVSAAGVIVLVAPCSEGLGSASLQRWLELGSVEAILAEIAKSADINAQTALSTLWRGRQAVLVTDMAPDLVRRMGMTPAATLAEALALTRERLPGGSQRAVRVLPMPEAWLTVPFAESA